jgi:hypothetical protein
MRFVFDRLVDPRRKDSPPRPWQLGLLASGVAATLALGCAGSDSASGGNGTAVTGGAASNSSQSGSPSSGGMTANGGASAGSATEAPGGKASSGGVTAMTDQGGATYATGGITASGGFNATGGSNDTGGAKATGGAKGTGGETGALNTGGNKSTGGAPGTGGAKSTGGATSPSNTGGSKSTGGVASTGGAKSTGGTAATGGTKNTAGSTSCYAAPATQVGTQAPAGTVSDYGTVLIWAKSPHQIVRLQTTMVVPPKPPASGTLFLWPGIDPDGANFLPIDNGVLQPVLTWGPACAPGTQPRAYSTWWISGQYVNTNGSVSGYTDCNGGPIMSVNVCDTLVMDIALSGTVWTQTITDEQTAQTVTYSIDMQNQAQNLAYFVIEEYSSAPVSEVIFTDTTLTFDSADAADCKVNMRGQTDYISTPTASSDGLQCSIQQIILRAQGIQ